MKAAQVDKSRSLTLTIPFNRIIEASSPELIEYVQKTNFPNYMKGPLMSSVVKSVLGEGTSSTSSDPICADTPRCRDFRCRRR